MNIEEMTQNILDYEKLDREFEQKKREDFKKWLEAEYLCKKVEYVDYFNSPKFLDTSVTEKDKIFNEYLKDKYFSELDMAYQTALYSIDNKFNSFFKRDVKDILSDMLKMKPLTPLTGEDEEWQEIEQSEKTKWYKTVYRNKRYYPLLKYVLSDDKIIYIDSINTVVYNAFNESYLDYSLICKMYYEEWFKIEFPYKVPDSPDKKIYTDIKSCAGLLYIGDTFVVTKIEDTLNGHNRICQVNRIFKVTKNTYSGDINEYDGITSITMQSIERNMIKQQQKEIEQLKQSISKLGLDIAYSK